MLTAPEAKCVQFTAVMERLLDSLDNTYDFVLDVTKEYNIAPFAGVVKEGAKPTFFSTQAVDFAMLGVDEANGFASGLMVYYSAVLVCFASILF